jgi:putative intracellular protease/amidase
MKITTIFLSAMLVACLALQGAAQATGDQNKKKMKTKKVLFVLTSADVVKTTGEKTGTWIEEFAAPYYFLSDKGIAITIATPEGGIAPLDPKSALPDYSTPAVKRYFNDKVVQEKLNHTAKLQDIRLEEYDAVFYPGGHGPMWDLPDNPLSVHIIESFYKENKPVALVCHGPAALKNVKGPDGTPLVKGKKVSGYTNDEEVAGKTTSAVPFSLEDMLKEKGADFVKGNNWQPFAVADGLLITGQNPASAALVAEKFLAALNR